jgi:hypothetical protein
MRGDGDRSEYELVSWPTFARELFFDHWLISTGPNQFKLNGKYEDFLKSHADHFKERFVTLDEAVRVLGQDTEYD